MMNKVRQDTLRVGMKLNYYKKRNTDKQNV